jgi:hypothetical protein
MIDFDLVLTNLSVNYGVRNMSIGMSIDVEHRDDGQRQR